MGSIPASTPGPAEPGGPGQDRDPSAVWAEAAQVLSEAVFGTDRSGRVREWNEAARRLFGYTPGEILGAPAPALFSRGPGETFAGLLQRASRGETLTRIPATARRRDGMLVQVELTMRPLSTGDGVCAVVRDVTEQVVTQEALAESHRRQSEALQLSKVGFWLWDRETDTVQMSDEMYRIHGIDPLDFGGTMAARISLAHPSDRRVLRRKLAAAIGGARPFEMEYRLIRPDGSVAWIHERAEPELTADGRSAGLSGVGQDVTERHLGAEAIRQHAETMDLLKRIAVAANEAGDLTEALQRCIADMCEVFAWDLGHAVLLGDGELVVRHMWHLGGGIDFPEFRRMVEETRPTGCGARLAEDGGPCWLHEGSTPLMRPARPHPVPRSGFRFPVAVDGSTLAVVEMYSGRRREPDRQLTDVAHHAAIQIGRVVERERSSCALTHQAMHDPLTGLPNRTLFLDRLGQSLTGIGSTDSHLAVMFMDLDNFKLINDSLGHDVGDRVLTSIARRLVTAMRAGDTAARFGGDEFIILCERLSTDEAVGDIANRLLATIAEPIVLDGDVKTVVTASVGIAIAASPDARPDHLLRDADAAMYRAKEEGRGRFHVFDPGLHERASRKLSIATELRSAVANGELRLDYQPQFRMADGHLLGVESLVRWDHPVRGTLGPAEWIPIAEETQLIVPIGEWILSEACRAGARWKALLGERAGPGFKVCVNVSAVQLARPALIDCVVAAVAETGIDPASLCLEITESVLMSAPTRYLEALLGLKMVGLSLAVDDFGTGYSSLAYLRRFPIDMIKIDKAFVDDLVPGERRGRAIMRAIVQLSKALGIMSVAEGVETAEQVAELAGAGCHAAQGYYYARPLPPDGITALIAPPAAGRAGGPPGAGG